IGRNGNDGREPAPSAEGLGECSAIARTKGRRSIQSAFLKLIVKPKRFVNISECSKFAALASAAISPSVIASGSPASSVIDKRPPQRSTSRNWTTQAAASGTSPSTVTRKAASKTSRAKGSALALAWAQLTLETP